MRVKNLLKGLLLVPFACMGHSLPLSTTTTKKMTNTLFKKILRILSTIAIAIFKLCACLIILFFILYAGYVLEDKASYKDLGGGITYYGGECITLGPDYAYIEPHIVSYNFNSHFIIAKQITVTKKTTNYWIIDKTQKIKIGPLNYLQFIEECRSRDIKLRFED